jgi:hypothetical protein
MSTLILTDEQINTLLQGCDFDTAPERSIASVCDAYAQMIQESKTHWIVEAPKGHQFAPDQLPHIDQCDDRFPFVTFQFRTKPIPAPCPPPKLDPVTVTVEDVYGQSPNVGPEWQQVFGIPRDLKIQGFTHAITPNELDVNPIETFGSMNPRICLRKWPA